MEAPPTNSIPLDVPVWMTVFAYVFGRFCARRWQALLGVSVLVVSALWDAIPLAEKELVSLEPVHLLWFLAWMKTYSSFEVCAAMWRVDRKTFHRRVMQVLDLLEQHLDLIHLDARLDSGPAFCDLGYTVVDTVLCPIEVDRKVWAHQKPFFSPKHGAHGLKYEVAVHWRTGRILWVAGGVAGAMSDITILRQGGLLAWVRSVQEYLLADKGYIGEEDAVLCPYKGRSHELTPAQWHWNHLLNPHRTIVENVLARITKFNILQAKYRGETSEHKRIFYVCAQIAQLDIFYHPLRADELECPERHVWLGEPEE